MKINTGKYLVRMFFLDENTVWLQGLPNIRVHSPIMFLLCIILVKVMLMNKNIWNYHSYRTRGINTNDYLMCFLIGIHSMNICWPSFYTSLCFRFLLDTWNWILSLKNTCHVLTLSTYKCDLIWKFLSFQM